MAVTLSITEDDVIDRVQAFLCAVTGLALDAVVRGQENRVSPPGAANYVVMWPVWRNRLATNVAGWASDPSASVIDTTQATQLDIQADLHGPRSGDLSQIVTTLWRDEWGCDFLANTGLDLAPLYCDDGRQLAFVDGQDQYEDRWSIRLSLQVNATVSTPQEFADTVSVELIEVDTTYPPEPAAP